MTSVQLAPQARRDMASIWTYTANTWGREQADNYTASLHRDIERLRALPELGSPYTSRVGNFRKLSCGHHLIFYQTDGYEVYIVRVLHERMDADAQIDSV